MEEKMQQLQQQLEASQKASTSSPPLVTRTVEKQAELKSTTPKVTQARSTAATQKAKTRAGKGFQMNCLWSKILNDQQTAATDLLKLCFLSVTPSSSSAAGGNVKLQESSDFSNQLNSAESIKRKSRVAHHPKPCATGRIIFSLLCLLQ